MSGTNMRAARFYKAFDIQIDQIPHPPPPGPDEVTIEVAWCGICGTDLHEYACGPLGISTSDHPHPLTGDYLPVTMGHEFCGRIATIPASDESQESGDGKSNRKVLKVGQAVMVDPRLHCGGQCYGCVSGTTNLCGTIGFLGLHGGGGGGAGFSEFVNVKADMCHVLPESVNLDDAALIEPLTVARHALEVSGVGSENWAELSVLVVGAGPVGLAVLFNLRSVGVKVVFVSEPTAKRSEMVKDLRLVADAESDVFNPLVSDVPAECKKRTHGKGVDIVFDCAGIPAGLQAGLDSLRIKGIYVNVAVWEKPMIIPLQYALVKELSIKFSMCYDEADFRHVVADFIAGKFAGCEKMVTARIDLSDVAVKGFDELMNNKDKQIKILATPKPGLLRRQKHG